MKKTYIVIAAALVVCVVGYFGYGQYQSHKLIKAMVPHVKNASLRLGNALRYETEESSNVTFKEAFENLEGNISEIDKRVIEVQTLASSDNKDMTDPVIAYLKGAQDLLRAELATYRKRLETSVASETSADAIKEMTNSWGYGVEFAIKRAKRAVSEFEKATIEKKEATAKFVSSAKSMEALRENAAKIMPADTLIDLSLLTQVEKKNEEKSAEKK